MSIEAYERAAQLLPPEMRKAARDLNSKERACAEELRLRAGYPPTVLCEGRELPLPLCAVTRRDLLTVLEFATGASAHTAQDSIRRGFVTARGGFRVGLCGTAVMGGDGIGALRDFSSLAIRIPTERRGCADAVYPRLFHSGLKSVLLLSPPGAGKTTLLRELIRRMSEGGYRVSVADERGEIAAVYGG
ncbi:MAG: stage III sporulation protein AB, partial [Firmicutes bacterium]|nr:stage III sporulation protein AB [Bacillota bacterium]